MTQKELKKDCMNFLKSSYKCKKIHKNTLLKIEQYVYKCVHNLKLMISIEIRADLKKIVKENYFNSLLLKNW
jgi:hypothetical protein